jgi:hypothetical protein
LVIRLPSDEDPGDTGWHIDGSFQGPTTDDLSTWCVDYRSTGRGLLLLCLHSDVGSDDAPTRFVEGSHRDVPKLLQPLGDAGAVARDLPLPQFRGSVALATGEAGDVFMCHPFLVHAASWPHRGSEPRVIAQPPISLEGSLRIEADHGVSPAARVVQRALAG